MGKRRFAREFLRDWDTAAGDPYYPEFQEFGREKYVHSLDSLPKGVTLFRGFDFGIRRPSCVWGAYSYPQDRLWILREFIPQNKSAADGLGTHHFRDTVLFLSGEIPYEQLSERAQYWVDWYAENGYPEGPWFEPSILWENFAGPECMRTEANAARDPRDATAAAIFESGGIPLTYQAGQVKARHEIFRRFLGLRPDGFPGVLFDPSCQELLRAMGGAFTFAKETAGNPVPDRPRKDGHYDNIIDALTYAVCALVPSDSMPLARRAPTGEYAPKAMGSEESVGWYETTGKINPESRPLVVAP